MKREREREGGRERERERERGRGREGERERESGPNPDGGDAALNGEVASKGELNAWAPALDANPTPLTGLHGTPTGWAPVGVPLVKGRVPG